MASGRPSGCDGRRGGVRRVGRLLDGRLSRVNVVAVTTSRASNVEGDRSREKVLSGFFLAPGNGNNQKAFFRGVIDYKSHFLWSYDNAEFVKHNRIEPVRR